ncbi:hypothetical protein BH09BAC6_BH09BAC6_30040 [soil metagenome]
MLKASALYIVIIIALVIALLCSSLIVAAYYYKIEYQQKFRYDHLQNNVSSGVNILLASQDTSYTSGKTFSLFNNDADSVSLKRISWGIFDIGISRAFIQKDTLYKTFSIANAIDSTKWAALYIIDEDRPISLSGKTTVRGDAYIPKAGVTTAYVANEAYKGDKRLIVGTKHNSERKLPILNKERLEQFQRLLNRTYTNDSGILKKDSLNQSFLSETRYANFKNKAQTIQNIHLSNNIILLSDTTITIDSTATLNNVLIFARSIVVKSGFKGNCQLFARDSIRVERNCRFDYPSCIGILRFKINKKDSQEKIVIGEKSIFNGSVFTYEESENKLKPLIDLGKNVKIYGQVYSHGICTYADKVEVKGSLFTSRFLYQSSFSIFENYLINIQLDSKLLSHYYLSSDLFPGASKNKKTLQWLEAN